MIKDIKCKKIKGSPYSAIVRVRTTEPIKNFKNEPYKKTLGENTVDKEITLLDCLDKLKTPEIIPEEEKWYCEKCREIRISHKTDKIYSVGSLFIVQFKRFTERGKITSKVNYPIENLDLSKYVD